MKKQTKSNSKECKAPDSLTNKDFKSSTSKFPKVGIDASADSLQKAEKIITQIEQSKLQEQIINVNYSKLKYISLISLGFSCYLLITDFLIQGVWHAEYLYYYKFLDIIFTIISVSAFSFFWLLKIKNIRIRKAGIILFPFLFLIWAAVLTGIDFSILGFSTFIIVLLLSTFFLYLSPITSIIYFLSSCFAIMITLYFRGDFMDNHLSLIFLLIPLVLISILISVKNYKSKFNDLLNQEKMVALNEKLQYSKENLELEVEKRMEEIKKALLKAEESDKLKTAFLHNMSHEVRTPLNAIVGYSQIIVEPNHSAEELETYSEIIIKSSDSLTDIITDVIEISQIQANQVKIKLTEIDMVLFITNVVTGFTKRAKEKDIALMLNQNIPHKEYFILSDIEKIEKIFTHLIGNALKFTHQGSIEISSKIQRETLQFTISDTGIGITDDTQKVIFEPFRQLETDLELNYRGNGLGLPIVKAYTKLLNGSISLKSEINKGTTFVLTLPTNNQSIEPSKTVINENYTKAIPETDYSVNTILIAEDEHTNYQYLHELLKNTDINILHAKNGQDAVDLCRNNNKIDLILMDIRMPVMDGNTAAKLIKAFRPDIPIIAQTAYALEEEKSNYSKVFDDYITKPINAKLFRQKMKVYIDGFTSH